MTPERAGALRGKLNQMSEATAHEDLSGYVQADFEVHLLIWRQADNPHLLNALRTLTGPIYMFIANNLGFSGWDQTLDVHEDLVECVTAGDRPGPWPASKATWPILSAAPGSPSRLASRPSRPDRSSFHPFRRTHGGTSIATCCLRCTAGWCGSAVRAGGHRPLQARPAEGRRHHLHRHGGLRGRRLHGPAPRRPDRRHAPQPRPQHRQGRRRPADDGRAPRQGDRLLPGPRRLDAHRRLRDRQPRRAAPSSAPASRSAWARRLGFKMRGEDRVAVPFTGDGGTQHRQLPREPEHGLHLGPACRLRASRTTSYGVSTRIERHGAGR